MQVNIQELVKAGGVGLSIYPGKKLVLPYQQPGEYKSHSVSINWKSPEHMRVELHAGLTGRQPDVKNLTKYPVSFQAPTYFELKIENEEDNDDEDEEGSKGKSGGGGQKPKENQLEDSEISLSAFDKVTDGDISEKGTIEKFVVMGKLLAQEAFGAAYENFKEQLSQTKVIALDIMKSVGDTIQKVQPGGGLEAKGNETVTYKYNPERTGPLFGAAAPS